MKSYIVDAYYTMKGLSRYIYNWYDIDDIIEAVERYERANWTNHLKVEFGSSRIVIISHNFVVKWNYHDGAINSIGGCEEELNMYYYACRCKKDYLFAEISCIYINGLFLYVMPFVSDVGRQEGWMENYLNNEDYQWLNEKVSDLHCANWGVIDGQCVIIDYACYNKWDIS